MWLSDVMLFLAAVLCSKLLAVLNKATHHPEQGVDPEYGEGANQESGHADKSPVADRVVLPVVHVAMGVELGKERCCIGMTLSAGAGQVGNVNA